MKGIVETVAGVIERLSISSTEKKRLKQELETLLVDYEREHLQVQSGVLRSEAQGNWLQRSWRPVIMLAFTVVILVGMFTDLPMPEDTSRFWDLLEIGLGGYIVGRFRKNSRKLSGPDMIVVHYTAGTSARTAAEFLAKEEVKASAHLVIGRQGELFQLVPFDTEAWHAGRSCYGGRANLNRYSIGIELDNLGRLQWQEGRFVAECGVEVAPADVYVDDTGEVATFWHRYTERQKRLLREICRLLKQHYPIRYVVGHSDITDRKQDPGPELHGFMCK